jgi:hypothetical protein
VRRLAPARGCRRMLLRGLSRGGGAQETPRGPVRDVRRGVVRAGRGSGRAPLGGVAAHARLGRLAKQAKPWATGLKDRRRPRAVLCPRAVLLSSRSKLGAGS